MFSQITSMASNYFCNLKQSFRKNRKKAGSEYVDLGLNYLQNWNLTEYLLGSYNLFYGNSLIQMLPQYRYVAMPVYRYFGGIDHPWIATAAAFCVTDLLIHQLPTNMFNCMLKGSIVCENTFNVNIAMHAYWVSLSIPIIIYKCHYLQKKDRRELQDREEKEITSIHQAAQFYENRHLMFANKTEHDMSGECDDRNMVRHYRR